MIRGLAHCIGNIGTCRLGCCILEFAKQHTSCKCVRPVRVALVATLETRMAHHSSSLCNAGTGQTAMYQPIKAHAHASLECAMYPCRTRHTAQTKASSNQRHAHMAWTGSCRTHAKSINAGLTKVVQEFFQHQKLLRGPFIGSWAGRHVVLSRVQSWASTYVRLGPQHQRTRGRGTALCHQMQAL